MLARVASKPKVCDHSNLKTLSPKQMLVKAGNTSENLQNEIRQIIYTICMEQKNY